MDLNRLFVFILLYGVKLASNSVSSASNYRYGKNCTINERLHCYVEESNCALNPTSDNAPAAPFDLRVHQALAAVPSREPNSYQLWVNISWHPPYDASITKVRGFELNVVDKESNKQWCFSFYLNETSRWDDRDRHNLPKFRFWTKDVFDFGRKYYIEVQSLPKSSNHSAKSNFISVDNVQMPEHPGISTLVGDPEAPLPDGAVNCSNFAHVDANKWIAAFRYINVKPWPKQIMVDFIAAPPQYCFEAYELRLLKAHHSIVSSTIVTKEFLYDELFGNITVTFGNHTFDNVAPGFYDIAIVPIDRSLNGRCLCPLPSKICTCSQAIWSDVELKDSANKKPIDPCDYIPPIRDPFLCRNQSRVSPPSSELPPDDENVVLAKGVPLLIILLLVALSFMVVGAILFRYFYKKYKAKGKDGRLYMIPIESMDFTPPPSGRELYAVKQIRLLVIYSHDCPLHDDVVSSMVAYLQAKCKCVVHTDFLCRREISKNKFDWIYESMKKADKVLIVLSHGAYARYQARFFSHPASADDGVPETYVVERNDPSEFDDLFLLQIDVLTATFSTNQSIDRRKFITIRFNYTPVDFSLPHFKSYVCYEIPKHFKSLICHLHNLPEDVDVIDFKQINDVDYCRSDEGNRLRKALDDMNEYVNENRDWFQKLHINKLVGRPTTPMRVENDIPSSYVAQQSTMNGSTTTAVQKPIANGTLLDQRSSTPPSVPAEKSPLLITNGHCLIDVDDDSSTNSHRLSLTNGDHLLETSSLNGKNNLDRKNLDSCDSGIGVDMNGSSNASTTTHSSSNNFPTGMRKLVSPTKKKLASNDDDLERRRLLIS